MSLVSFFDFGEAVQAFYFRLFFPPPEFSLPQSLSLFLALNRHLRGGRVLCGHRTAGR